jgi:hypothetical protein
MARITIGTIYCIKHQGNSGLPPIGTIKLRSPGAFAVRGMAGPFRCRHAAAAFAAAAATRLASTSAGGTLPGPQAAKPDAAAMDFYGRITAMLSPAPRVAQAPGGAAIINKTQGATCNLRGAAFFAGTRHGTRLAARTAKVLVSGSPPLAPPRASALTMEHLPPRPRRHAAFQPSAGVHVFVPEPSCRALSSASKSMRTIASLPPGVNVGLTPNRDDHVTKIPVVFTRRPASSGG